uniref:Actin related protein 6 n=1 Tax=Suricata suricatta TaxID=37032 RepID=A0A673V4A9_SURSU
MTTLVLDNGAYNAKIGYSHENVSVIPNCQFRSKTARLKTFTANQIDEIKDPSGLFYILPFQKLVLSVHIGIFEIILPNYAVSL